MTPNIPKKIQPPSTSPKESTPLDVESFKRKKASQRGKELIKHSFNKTLKDLQKKYTLGEIGKMLGVKRMVTYRWWSKNKKISPCYSRLLERLQNDLGLGENPEVNIMETQEALKRLEDHKKNCGSWDKLAKKISINKKTIMRWRKTRKINQGYRRILYYFFKESKAEC